MNVAGIMCCKVVCEKEMDRQNDLRCRSKSPRASLPTAALRGPDAWYHAPNTGVGALVQLCADVSPQGAQNTREQNSASHGMHTPARAHRGQASPCAVPSAPPLTDPLNSTAGVGTGAAASVSCITWKKRTSAGLDMSSTTIMKVEGSMSAGVPQAGMGCRVLWDKRECRGRGRGRCRCRGVGQGQKEATQKWL